MDANKLNDWLGIATSAGVIVGLGLVAYEVNQTNVALEREYGSWITSTQLATNQMWVDWNSLIMEREQAELWRSGIHGEELDSTDEERFFRLSLGFFWLYNSMYHNGNRISQNGGEGAARWLATEMVDRPGLHKYFQQWSDVYRVGEFAEKVSFYLEELEFANN